MSRAARLPALHGRPWAAGAYLAFTALVGLAWSAPLAAALGSATGAYPRGDAELYDAGAVMLIEALRHLRSSLSVLTAAWLVLALFALPAGMLVFAFCAALLGAPGRARPTWALARAVRSLPTFALIGLVVLIADAALVALIMTIGGALARSSWPQPPSRDIARWSLMLLSFLAVSAVGVLHDLARAAAVTGPARTYSSLRAALLVARRRPGRAAWAYTWRTLAGAAAACAAWWLGQRIGNATPAALWLTALVHQLGVAAVGWCRLAWLAQAVRLVAPESAAK